MASTHPLVERLRAGDAPAPLKSAAARGALPLPPEDLLEALFCLRRDADLQADIRRTLESMPTGPLVQVAADASTAGPMLDFLARACFAREPVLEQLARNPSTLDATLALLARHGNESILEMLSFNQVRLTRAPALVQAMLQNPHCPLSIRRRLQEMQALDEQDLARASAVAARAEPAPLAAALAEPVQAPAAAPEAAAEPVVAEMETPTAEEAAAASATSLEDLADLDVNARILEEMAADDASEEELRLAQKLLTMNVPEKVALAMKGDRNVRMVLIRDSSKQVQEAVITSPKITDNEVERISNMRGVSEDVIRLLCTRRDALKIYQVVHNLVKNPKTPQALAMQLMPRLQTRDLQFIVKDKNIAETVRRHANVTLDKRKPKATIKKSGH
jgi:hypothetical protein